jgi:predicted alpha/beta-hydrolase family hydrolase
MPDEGAGARAAPPEIAGAFAVADSHGATVQLDTLLLRPDDAWALLVLAHGAGANMRHVNMNAIAGALALRGIATLRFDFPFMQAGRKRVDDTPTAVRSVVTAVTHARTLEPALPLFAGGHSFGGRMTSHAAPALPDVQGLVLLSFPLHTAGRPATTRAAHLPGIQLPMVFVSGTRDALAEPELLTQTVASLPTAQLCWLHDADHGYAARQRERVGRQNIFDELADCVANWLRASLGLV